MLKQLVSISDNSIVQELDVFVPVFDSTGKQTNAPTQEQVLELPTFGGPWGDPKLFKWVDAPSPVVVQKAVDKKLQTIKSDMELALSQGFTTTNGIKMDATYSAIQMLKSGYDLTILNKAATMTITDFNNVDHLSVLIADVNTMILELGNNYNAERTRKNIRRTAVLTAQSSSKTLVNKLADISAV